MSTDHLILLAGGRSSRLSPLTGSSSKALVTVGQRPVIIQQIIGLGIKKVTVVVSPATLKPIRDTLQRGLPASYHVDYTVQDVPLGPEHAIRLGTSLVPLDQSVMVLFADTLLDWESVSHHGSWIGVAEGNTERSWCHMTEHGHWLDGRPNFACPLVFVGVLRAEKASNLVYTIGTTDRTPDGMSNLLNGLRHQAFECERMRGWLDTGDLAALAAARRAAFRSRDDHKIVLTDYGTIIKVGVRDGEVKALRSCSLFPPVIKHASDHVEMEYVSQPSLAELFLYGSSNRVAWEHILRTVIDRCERYLWSISTTVTSAAQGVHRARAVYTLKTVARAEAHIWSQHHFRALLDRLEPIITSAGDPRRNVFLHGDLNFCNILYDVGTDIVRLIDPRGSWGDDTGYGDILYEAAKLRYSWRGFAAINHDVYGRRNDPELEAVLDRVLEEKLLAPYDLTLADCSAVEAALFWSAVPLHPEHQRAALIEMGYKCLSEA